MKTTLDIIIVNWNSGDFLIQCIKSIKESVINKCIVKKIIIVDNASEDNSLKNVTEKYNPLESYNIHIILNQRNEGFAKACNQGALEAQSMYLLFLNPDTRLYPDTLEKAIHFTQTLKESAGVIGVQLIDEFGSISKTCRYLPTKRRRLAKIIGLSRLFPSTSTEMRHWDHKSTRAVEQVMGAFFLVESELFNQLNGFDERFFVYFEEVDFCKRVMETNRKNIFFSECQVYHKAGGTSDKIKALRLFYNLRSWLLYEKKHNGKLAAKLGFLIILLEYLSRSLFIVLKGRIYEINELNKAYSLLFSEIGIILN